MTSAERDLADAQENLDSANQKFCDAGADYVTAIDRCGKVFGDAKVTVGDVKTAGADLVGPQTSVTAAINDVTSARDDVARANKELTDANTALAEANATASGTPTSASSGESTTTTTIVSQVSVTRVEQAESDFDKAAEGITDQTPIVEAGAAFNSAAFALEVTWLQLLADAGCLSDEQHAQAVTQVHDYTVALETDLFLAGYYKGEIDGIYGPAVVEAVQALQAESGLPETGLVDRATALALDETVQAVGAGVATQSVTQTAGLQSVLKVAGYWTGPVDGVWTEELTTALEEFQTALGVPPSGSVDAATLQALEDAIATAKDAASGTTTSAPEDEPSDTTTPSDSAATTSLPGE